MVEIITSIGIGYFEGRVGRCFSLIMVVVVVVDDPDQNVTYRVKCSFQWNVDSLEWNLLNCSSIKLKEYAVVFVKIHQHC